MTRSSGARDLSYRILGIEPTEVAALFERTDAELADLGACWHRVRECPGAPERIALTDVPIGEDVLLVNYLHLDVASPFRSRHAIYLWPGSGPRFDRVDQLPTTFRHRVLSVRAYDDTGYLVAAELTHWRGPANHPIGGTEIEETLRGLLAMPAVEFLHVHYAAPGCYAARVVRA